MAGSAMAACVRCTWGMKVLAKGLKGTLQGFSPAITSHGLRPLSKMQMSTALMVICFVHLFDQKEIFYIR